MSFPRPVRAVVFDLDGTLIDSESLVRASYFSACGEFGIAMSDAQFLSLVGLHRDANDHKMRGYYGDDFPLADFYECVRGHIGEQVAPLKPGALELMDALDAMPAPFALATSSRRPWVERHFAAHNLTHRFRAIVARDDCINGKPHPEPYLKAAAALSVEPRDVLALEDSHAGAESAHAAGMMVAVIPDLLTPDEATRQRALAIVQTLHDVRALLSSAL